jgi:hypothetical protein
VELLVLVAVFWALMTALGIVGWASWRRTTRLRKGTSPDQPASKPDIVRSSRTTFLAAATGASVAIAGGLSVARNPPNPIALVVSALGVWILAGGLWSRVAGFETFGSGLVLHYGRRHSFRVIWAECRSLRPPRWPMGGWRLATEGGSQTLMPSDVLGNEWMLEHVVRSAGLSFYGRKWIRKSPIR